MRDHFWQFPHGFSIFCDDIRQEIGGKITLVGVYNVAILAMDGFPLVIPKLCFSTRYREPLLMERASELIFKLIVNDGPEDRVVFEHIVSVSTIKPYDIMAESEETDPTSFWEFIINGMVSPLIIKDTSKIRMRAYRDGEEQRLGALLIRAPTDDERAYMAGSPPRKGRVKRPRN
jgi:hypothetical protein